MKSNYQKLSVTLLIVGLITGNFLLASVPKSKEDNENIGIKYKKDSGIFITSISAKIIDLKMADVKEIVIPNKRQMTAQVYDISTPGLALASAWLPAEEAKQLSVGIQVTLDNSTSGRITGVSNLTSSANLSAEILIELDNKGELLTNHQFVKITAFLPNNDTILVVPKSAVLTTSEGVFVYVDNAGWKIRTSVVIGREHEGMVEISEGVFEGDVVVASPVMTLWMTELQLTKSGKPCSCGH